MQQWPEHNSPCQVEAFVEEEEALDAAAPLTGSCGQAQAAPCHLAHLIPDVLPLHMPQRLQDSGYMLCVCVCVCESVR